MSGTTPFIDVHQIRRNFARAAARYDAADVLAREVDSRMLERLDYIKIEPPRVLDLGCGTGASLTALAERYPKASVLGADFSEAMLHAGRAGRSHLRWLMPFLRGNKALLSAADASALPFKSRSMGLIWSNLMMHWVNDPLPVFREMHRVLDVGGLLMFSTVGPDTLKELRACFSDRYEHTQRFIDMHDVGDMLMESGFSDPVMDAEVLTLTYPGVDDLFRDLRQSGAGCVMATRRHGLMGREAMAAVRTEYEKWIRDGRLPATIEVVYGHAWKAPSDKTEDGRQIVRFDPNPRLR